MSVRLVFALVSRAEIVILILPSTAESQGLIDARRLALMRQGALLVECRARTDSCRPMRWSRRCKRDGFALRLT